MNCLYSFGPLCWTEAWKFYVWAVSMIVIWSAVGWNIFRKRK